MIDKYNELPFQYFGFELFEEIFERINNQKSVTDDPTFHAGIASAEAAVRRLREEHYEAITARLR